MEELPERAAKAVERIMSGNVFKIDLEACELLTAMSSEIINLQNKVKELEKEQNERG